MEYGIEDLIKKIDCWRFWGYCLVASYQYYRICATFMIKRQSWADVHRHMGRLFPEGEPTTRQDVLGRLRSRRRASGTGDALDVFVRLSPVDGSQECPKMVIGQGVTLTLIDLVDKAMCIICLHGPEDEASVNEDMPSAVHWILETMTRIIREMGEHIQYPSGMHWLDFSHQLIHVTCMIRSFYRMEEWKCPHCRHTLASGLWGPIKNVNIDTSLWPASF